MGLSFAWMFAETNPDVKAVATGAVTSVLNTATLKTLIYAKLFPYYIFTQGCRFSYECCCFFFFFRGLVNLERNHSMRALYLLGTDYVGKINFSKN